MKNLLTFFILLLLCGCDQTEIVQLERDKVMIPEIATSRSASYSLDSISVEKYIEMNETYCYDRYEGYAMIRNGKPNRLVITGLGLGDEMGSIRVVVGREELDHQIISWHDTIIELEITPSNIEYQAYVLKVYVSPTHDDEYKRITIGATHGLPITLEGETSYYHYPLSLWQCAQLTIEKKQGNRFAMPITNYKPQKGDILAGGRRYAYVRYAGIKGGYLVAIVDERDKNCNGRLASGRNYVIHEGHLLPRIDEDKVADFNLVYRLEE